MFMLVRRGRALHLKAIPLAARARYTLVVIVSQYKGLYAVTLRIQVTVAKPAPVHTLLRNFECYQVVFSRWPGDAH
jgi:hypothetical protein